MWFSYNRFYDTNMIGWVESFPLSGPTGSVLDHRSLPPEFKSWCGHIWRVFDLWLCLITYKALPEPTRIINQINRPCLTSCIHSNRTTHLMKSVRVWKSLCMVMVDGRWGFESQPSCNYTRESLWSVRLQAILNLWIIEYTIFISLNEVASHANNWHASYYCYYYYYY